MSQTPMQVDSSPDQVEDQVTEDLRLGLLVATQAAQHLLQRFAERQREAQRWAADTSRQLQAELEAHRALALAATRGVGDDRWWQETAPRDLTHAWQVARVWEDRDPQLGGRAQMMREAFADRFGIQDPDQLTVRDLIQTAESSAEARARAASPLAQAEWEVAQFGSYADELGREAERLQEVVEDTAAAGPDGEPRSETDHEWATSRLAALQDLQGWAVDERDAANDRAERLRATGANSADQGPESAWAKQWDTPERRDALRSRLQNTNNLPSDAVEARLLTDRAQGLPPGAATWHRSSHGRQGTPARAEQAQRQPQRHR